MSLAAAINYGMNETITFMASFTTKAIPYSRNVSLDLVQNCSFHVVKESPFATLGLWPLLTKSVINKLQSKKPILIRHCGILIRHYTYSILWVSGEKGSDIIQNWSENDQGANSYFVLLSQYIENLTSFVHWQDEVNKIEGPLSTTRTLEIRRTICMKQIIECTW